MNKNIFLSMIIMLILVLNSAAQTYDLKFNVVNSDETNFDVQIQIKSSSTFKLAASNITFNYNILAISNPTLLSAQNYSGVGGSPLHIYSPLTVTPPNDGITSVNIIYTQSDDSFASDVPTSWTDVAVVRYDVVNSGNTPNLVFRTSDLSPTTIYKMEGSTLTLLPSGNLYSLNDPMPVELSSFSAYVNNNNVFLKWQTATEINNFGFEVERKAESMENGASDNWGKIGFVEGNGNSNSPIEYFFTDKNLKGGFYLYRLKQINNDGKFEYSSEVKVSIKEMLSEFTLQQNFPNPFNPVTKIKFSIPKLSRVNLSVYNVIGELMKVLEDNILEAGSYQKEFDASGMASGIYICRLVSNGQVQTKIMNLLK